MSIEAYKQLIDDLVARAPSVEARRVRELTAWPELPENTELNQLLASLGTDQREVLAQLLQSTREGGIHDVLAYLQEQADLGGLQLVKAGEALPNEPFDTQLYYDWVCRLAGDDWPEVDDAT